MRRSRPAIAARSSDCRPKTLSRRSTRRAPRASRSRACTCTSARSCSRRRLYARRSRGWQRSQPSVGHAWVGCQAASTSAAASASSTSSKEEAPSIETFVGSLVERVAEEWERHELPSADLVLEPGRSLVGRAGVTLYRVGVVKRASERVTYVAIDGGMSDNPRPQLYGALYSAIVADRVDDLYRSLLGLRQALRVRGRPHRRRPSRVRGAEMSSPCPRRAPTPWRCLRTTTRCPVRPPSSSRRVRRE